MPTTIKKWLKSAKNQIDPLDAELILVKVCGFSDRSDLILREDQALALSEQAQADSFLAQRLSGKPLAYIFQAKGFYGREFYVDENVLIPRPETETIIDLAREVLVGQAWAFRKHGNSDLFCKNVYSRLSRQVRPQGGSAGDTAYDIFTRQVPCCRKAQACPIRVIDLGTGSGVLAITLSLELNAKVLAIDNSSSALKVAQKNAQNLQAENLEFLQSDLLTALIKSQTNPERKTPQTFSSSKTTPKPTFQPQNWHQVDLIVANLPYVDKNWDFLSPELRFEPQTALFADHHGLALIEKLLGQLATGPIKTKYLILEADPCQHTQVIALAQKSHFQLIQKVGYQLLLSRLSTPTP